MKTPQENHLTWNQFTDVEMRVGTILTAEVFEEVRNPAYKMTVDFGEFGIKKTSAQITHLYQPQDLIGRQIIAVVNFPPKQIANIMSECLVLGAVGDEKDIVLVAPERTVRNGLRVG